MSDEIYLGECPHGKVDGRWCLACAHAEIVRLRDALRPLASKCRADRDDNTFFLVQNSLLRKAKEAMS